MSSKARRRAHGPSRFGEHPIGGTIYPRRPTSKVLLRSVRAWLRVPGAVPNREASYAPRLVARAHGYIGGYGPRADLEASWTLWAFASGARGLFARRGSARI